MANKRILVKRRKSVRNIRKITRTMQLIATARFQAAYNRATASRPYAEKLAELVADISAAAKSVDHPLMKRPDDVKRTAMVVITSRRGLCGGYNANVLRTAIGQLDRLGAEGFQNDLYMVGKKGINYFKFLRRPMVDRVTTISDAPKYEEVQPIATMLMDRFRRGEIASVFVVYMKFVSSSRQHPAVLELVPLTRRPGRVDEESGDSAGSSAKDYEFSPAPAELLDELLPATVRAQLFQCFTEAAVSEQIARMVAMKSATDAATDMIKLLTRRYNRARQTAITMELLDIVGGANAIA